MNILIGVVIYIVLGSAFTLLVTAPLYGFNRLGDDE